MALTDKDIIITTNMGQTSDPKIEFKGADATLGAQTISLNVYPTDSGTLSFEGSAGQLFSITNSLTGTIFSVNDISGIPSIEVLDTGVVKLAPYGGSVSISTISSGIWNGSTIGVQYGGTGVTTITGIVKGNGTSALTSAIAGTDYVSPSGSETITNKTMNYNQNTFLNFPEPTPFNNPTALAQAHAIALSF